MSDRSDDDDLDDASLKSMRAVWLSMRDEEPPAAGMSALLAAAREQAEKMSAQPSWWQRALAVLRKPPALAFATVMLLVGGAVLVTRSGEHEKVDSLVADQAPATETRMRESEAQQQAPAAATTPVEQPPAPAHVEPESVTLEPPKDVTVDKPKPAPKPRAHVAGTKSTEEKPGKNEPDRYNRFDTTDAKEGFTGSKGGKADEPRAGFAEGKIEDKAEDSGGDLAAPGRVEPTAPAPMKPDVAKEPATDAVTVTTKGKVQTPPLEQLARRAESAASRSDCAAVRTIVARIKQQDASFFKTRLGQNAAVTKCL